MYHAISHLGVIAFISTLYVSGPAFARPNDNPVKPANHSGKPVDPRLNPVTCWCKGSIIEPMIAAQGCTNVPKPESCPGDGKDGGTDGGTGRRNGK